MELQNPCLAFTVGDEANDGKKTANNNACLRDYISIGGICFFNFAKNLIFPNTNSYDRRLIFLSI